MKLSLLFAHRAHRAPSEVLVTSMKLGLVFPDDEPAQHPRDDAPPAP